jgi:hypothetical protein
VRRLAARLGRERPRIALIRAAADLLWDRDDAVVAEAEATLEHTAGRWADLDDQERDALDQALSSLARRFPEHRRRGVLRAALAVADRAGQAVSAWLSEGDEASLMALRSEMKRSESGVADRPRLVRVLGVPALAPAAADRLLDPATAEAHEASLELAPLLLSRGRAAALRRLKDPLRTLPAQSDLEGLSMGARLGALTWAAAVPSPSGKRAAALWEMLLDPEPVVRFGAVRRLEALAPACEAAREALREATFDSEPRVARAALEALVGIDPKLARACAWSLLRSEHALVRAAARTIAPAPAESALVEAWDRIERNESRGWALLRAALAQDPTTVAALLRGKIAAGEPASRCRAAAAARRLGVVEAVEAELLAAAQGENERVAAAAVSALGESGSTAARAVLSAALGHADGRVRANAVEAISRTNPDAPVVRAWVSSDVPRARGNAVRARLLLAGDPAGADSLASMLTDDRRGHRLSGLWVAERAGLTSVSDRVAEIARRETEPRVRNRARRCARRLLAEMRLRENSSAVSREAAAAAR